MRLAAPLALLLTLASLMAGCTSAPGSDDPAAPGAPDKTQAPAVPATPSPPGMGPGGTTQAFAVYNFKDTLTGTSPPAPSGNGGPSPPAKMEKYTVEPGATLVTYKGLVESGTGEGRIEVYANDKVVYASALTAGAGPPGGTGVISDQAPEQPPAADAPKAGEFTVRYYVSGTMEMSLQVMATYPYGVGMYK